MLRYRQNSGFTIVEMLTAMIVVAVMMSASIAVMSTSNPRGELRNATNMVTHILEYARLRAAQRNRAYEVVINKNKITLNESVDASCQRSSFTAGIANVQVLDLSKKVSTDTTIAISSPTGLKGTGDDTFCIKPNNSVYKTNSYLAVSVAYTQTTVNNLVGNNIRYRVTTIRETAGSSQFVFSNNIDITYSGRVRVSIHQ